MELGAFEEGLDPIKDKLNSGIGLTPTSQTFYPALKAAKRMEKKILDQLEESSASKHLRNVAFEMALFGTGILKGPFAFDKEMANWDEEGNYSPESKTVPKALLGKPCSLRRIPRIWLTNEGGHIKCHKENRRRSERAAAF